MAILAKGEEPPVGHILPWATRPGKAPSDGSTVLDAIRAATARTRASVIQIDSDTDAFLIPVMGNTPGGGGTYFRSDFTIINYRSTDQVVGFGWLPQNTPLSATDQLIVQVVPANTPLVIDDFVGRVLGKSGIGALVVFARATANGVGVNDTSGRIDGFSRIWTPQPNTVAGSVSQSFPAYSIDDSYGSPTAYALGLQHGGGFRTNVGIVNLDSVAHTWTFAVNGLGGRTSFTLTVPAYSMNQRAVPDGNWGRMIVSAKPDGFGFYWSGYASSTDNVTGDGWVAHFAQ